MKNILLILCFLFVVIPSVVASENVIKLHYQPGLVASGRFVDVSFKSFGPDKLTAQIFEKLENIETAGRLDYLVPDAPSMVIEVTYEGKTIRSANSYDVPKPQDFAKFDKLWKEAYALAWQAIEMDMKVKD